MDKSGPGSPCGGRVLTADNLRRARGRIPVEDDGYLFLDAFEHGPEVAMWLALRAAFSHGKFLHARHQMLGGVAMMIGIMILFLLPMAANFYANPTDASHGSALRLDILSSNNIACKHRL
jgi:hypothetical protein